MPKPPTKYAHGEVQPDELFENLLECQAPNCPIDPWLPRLRWLLHCEVTEEFEERHRKADILHGQIIDLLNDTKQQDPMVVAHACFETMITAWKNMKRMIEHEQFKNVVH